MLGLVKITTRPFLISLKNSKDMQTAMASATVWQNRHRDPKLDGHKQHKQRRRQREPLLRFFAMMGFSSAIVKTAIEILFLKPYFLSVSKLESVLLLNSQS